MRIAFVDTPAPELWDDRLEPNLGLLYLATYLKINGYDVEFIDLRETPRSKWYKLLDVNAQVYGFSTYTPTYHITLEITKIVKEINPNAILVAGGPHATALPHEVAKDFDFVIKGEGETKMLELVRYIERGIQLKTKIIEGTPVEDLDSLPFPDYSLCDINSYKRQIKGKKCLCILSSRGCPYRCTFCNSIIMGRGRKVRFRSPNNVVEEIKYLNETYNIEAFRFNDDLFIFNPRRVREINRLLRPLGIIYRCFGRVDLCTKEVASWLVEGGCTHISFGVESGSQKMLDLMNKNLTIKDIKEGIKNAKEAGLTVRVYLIVGFPGETWETIKETVNLMLECMPDEMEVYNFIPYPGTPVFQNPEKYGIIYIEKDWSKYWQTLGDKDSGYVFETKDLNSKTIREMREYLIEKLSPHIRWAGESKSFR